ncbi:MAG: DUF2304 domain-containing protein [Lachnospiraceae bacterium]|nr:DUF2304 domain-containing protein [Lachnospiraceae bacterium]
MTIRLQIVIGVILVSFMLIIVNMIRKKKFDLRYALSWLTMLVVALILDIFPRIVFGLAHVIGIDIPSNMVFFVGLILAIIMIFTIAVSVSRMSNRVKKLTQELALLQKELDEIKGNK